MGVYPALNAAGAPLRRPVRSRRCTLINAETDEPVPGFDPILEGATLKLSDLPTRKLSIRANTSAPNVGSVKFGLDGNDDYRTEKRPPYALTGDQGGDYAAWTPSVGKHRVTATAGGKTVTLSFKVAED